MPKLLLRFDDFCALSDTALERRVLAAVREAGAKLVVSVVPFVADTDWEVGGPIPLRPLSAEKADLLKEFLPAHAEIALHGYSHQTITRWSHLYEFGDKVTRQRQVERLRHAKAFLEDLFAVKVESFVPPWNEYGRITIAALEEAEFKILAGDVMIGPAEGGLAFLPSCCILTNLEFAISTAASDPDALVSTTIHEYDFAESGSDLAVTDFSGLARPLASISSQSTNRKGFIDCAANGSWPASRLKGNREFRKALQPPP